MNEKRFYRWFWPFFLTLTVQNLIVIGVNLTDNVMLGSFSQSALSGAAAVNQIQILMQMIIGGAADGCVALASQYWGQGRVQPIKKIGAAALYASVGIALIFFVLVSFCPRLAVKAFTDDPAITEQALAYLNVIRFTYPFFGLTLALLAIMRSVETVKIALIISAFSFILNLPLNYIFIFGKPNMGAAGAATATLICRFLELSIAVFYLLKFENRLHIKWKEFFKTERSLLADYLRVSAPLLVVGLQYGLNLAAHMVILGHLTADAIAANSIAVNLVSMLKIIAAASAVAAGVIIGKTVGAGDIDQVKVYTRILQRIFIGIGLFSCAAILLLRAPILGLYNINDTAKQLAWDFLLVLSLTNIGTAYQMPTAAGIVRGGGDTAFVMKNDLISIWLIVIPLSAAAAFWFHWPPTAVLICLYSDQVFKCLPVAIKVNRYNWMKKLTQPIIS